MVRVPVEHRPVETKVKGAALGAGASGTLVAFLVWLMQRYGWLTEPNGALDPVVVAMVAEVVAVAGAFIGGYVMPPMARHRLPSPALRYRLTGGGATAIRGHSDTEED